MNIVYFDALNDPAAGEPIETQVNRFLVAQAIMLSLRGVPGIYFHSLFGSRNDREAALASGINRRINRQKMIRAELEAELMESRSVRAGVFGGYRRLLGARRNQPAFHPCGEQRVLACDPRIFAVLRTSPDGGERVLCVHNVSNEALVASIAGDEFVLDDTWTDLLSERARSVTAGRTLAVRLGPYEVNWLRLKPSQP